MDPNRLRSRTRVTIFKFQDALSSKNRLRSRTLVTIVKFSQGVPQLLDPIAKDFFFKVVEALTTQIVRLAQEEIHQQQRLDSVFAVFVAQNFSLFIITVEEEILFVPPAPLLVTAFLFCPGATYESAGQEVVKWSILDERWLNVHRLCCSLKLQT